MDFRALYDTLASQKGLQGVLLTKLYFSRRHHVNCIESSLVKKKLYSPHYGMRDKSSMFLFAALKNLIFLVFNSELNGTIRILCLCQANGATET